jgi:hypothetical protein
VSYPAVSGVVIVIVSPPRAGRLFGKRVKRYEAQFEIKPFREELENFEVDGMT